MRAVLTGALLLHAFAYWVTDGDTRAVPFVWVACAVWGWVCGVVDGRP